MDTKTRETLRTLILSRIAELKETAPNPSAAQALELDQQKIGRLSRMDAIQQQAMSSATAQRRQIEITRLQAALGRLDGLDYGYCEDCGEEIPSKRLEFDPAAIRCVSCASG